MIDVHMYIQWKYAEGGGGERFIDTFKLPAIPRVGEFVIVNDEQIVVVEVQYTAGVDSVAITGSKL